MVQRGIMTVRLPAELLSKAKEVKAARESMNDLIVEAVEREVRRRQGLQAHEIILAQRARVGARTGPQPDVVGLIRALREGEETRG